MEAEKQLTHAKKRLLTLTASRIIFGFSIKSNIFLFLQVVNKEIFNKLNILGKYRKPPGGVKTL